MDTEQASLQRSMSWPKFPTPPHSRKDLLRFHSVPTRPGEFVFTAGSKTGQLLILKNGVVSILKDGIEITTVADPGAVFGELSALLDQPHTADVRALETSRFYVADALGLFVQDPTAILYIAAILAGRLNTANRVVIELKKQLAAGQPHNVLGKKLEELEGLLSSGGASFVYSGYPTDPYG